MTCLWKIDNCTFLFSFTDLGTMFLLTWDKPEYKLVPIAICFMLRIFALSTVKSLVEDMNSVSTAELNWVTTKFTSSSSCDGSSSEIISIIQSFTLRKSSSVIESDPSKRKTMSSGVCLQIFLNCSVLHSTFGFRTQSPDGVLLYPARQFSQLFPALAPWQPYKL